MNGYNMNKMSLWSPPDIQEAPTESLLKHYLERCSKSPEKTIKLREPHPIASKGAILVESCFI